ncbi:integrase [Paractinoplanes brasiliensis]|uniref:integrase n=1 Tax=Paractinoplanes brasiliensis TaxID=52695 RepID=UPI00105BD23A|nr:integrase [Actinoplanes brasiliensis]
MDFFADTSPWPRRLWDVSSALALEEAWETGDWQRQQVLSPGAVSWYLRTLERLLGPDRGLGDSRLRKELTDLLRSGLAPDSQQRRRLRQLMPLVNDGYLDRWAETVESTRPPSPERLARAIATHLLDRGWSSGRLHRWVHDTSQAPGVTLRHLLEVATDLAATSDSEFEVMVPFVSVPSYQTLAEPLPEWRSAQATAAWFRKQGVMQPPRHNGGFIYYLRAKDPVAAVRAAGGLVLRLQARSSYARTGRGRLEPVGRAWVASHPDSLPVQPPARGADVLSLKRERTMYSVTASDRLDDALELAAPLNEGPPAPAVSGAWAAIESLLHHPGDKADPDADRAVAADRLAALVACSWPRAELTALSYRHRPAQPDDLSEALQRTRTNAQRCQLVAEALSKGVKPAVSSPGDVAACQRMARLLADPQKELSDVRVVFEAALRRLYRQRNIVAHGGTTAAVALDAALRTAAPLVGAGLDRLLHAALTLGIEPLDLAARAENSLALVGDPLGPPLTGLLD